MGAARAWSWRLRLLAAVAALVGCADRGGVHGEDAPVDATTTAGADVEAEVDAGDDTDGDALVETDAAGDAEVDVDTAGDAEVDGDGEARDGEDREDGDGGVAPPPPWRSALYPEDWTPAFTHASGAFLHDFSWAGYHHGEAELGAGLGEGGVASLARFDVTTYGATPVAPDAPHDGSDATAAFQAAIDAASEAGGGLVFVPAGLYRLDGTLEVLASRVVLGGEGASASRLWFTRVAGMSYAAHIRFAGASQIAATSALTADALARATVVAVADASPFTVGDDVRLGQVVSDGFVAEHGMTGTWQAFNGTWQPFFHRTVVAVDAAAGTITLDVPLRYPMKVAHGASVSRVSGLLHEVGVQDLGLANATGWDEAWATNQVHVLALDAVVDAWVRGVSSFPSPGAPSEGLGQGAHLISSGVLVSMSKRVTIADTHLARSEHRGSGGNGYLFELRQASEVLTRDASGTAGRHNFIQNWGFGATGNVWLRVTSQGGESVIAPELGWSTVGTSEYHHSLATANLFDASRADDGLRAVNRGDESSGAGHTATECVFWNTAGAFVTSRQYGLGYVVGTQPGTQVSTKVDTFDGAGTAPEDWKEGVGEAAGLVPQSLYEDQLARRLARPGRR